jgi:thymidylate kinase
MTANTSAKITIFEGPDGSGKTTAAKEWAERTGARYVHLSAYPNVSSSLMSMYVEAILPALLGYQDVVLDRSWYSERPYGKIYRGGLYRVTDHQISVLDRLALRCGAVIILCDAPIDAIISCFKSRKQIEYLDNELQLVGVVNEYRTQEYGLPLIKYDRTSRPLEKMIDRYATSVQAVRPPSAPLSVPSWVGCLDSEILIVLPRGQHFTGDTLYQWPGNSVTHNMHDLYVTKMLGKCGISEMDVQWCFADELHQVFDFPDHVFYLPKDIVVIGENTLSEMGRSHEKLALSKVHVFDSVISATDFMKELFQ